MRSFAVVALLIAIAGGFRGEAPAPAPGPAPAPAPAPAKDERPQLGVQIDERSSTFDKGLPVLHVIPGSTAAAMGIQVGDLITSVNGTNMTRVADLQTLMPTLKIGDAISIDVQRGAEKKTLSGSMQRAASIRGVADEVRDMRRELDDARRQAGLGDKKEPTLAEILQMLGEIEKQLPKAVAEFKKQYPDGEFDIDLKIRIVSDKKAKDPIDLVPQDAAEQDDGAVEQAPPAK